MTRSKILSHEPAPPRGHRIALYIRVSTEEQAENPEGSIKSQEQRLRLHIQFKNTETFFGEVSEVFIDRARSGKDTNRPELQRMLSSVARNEISLIMVTELSRLSRSIKDFCDIWELMRKHGCEFQSLREQFDTTSAAGEMVLYTIANIAQFERRQVAERVTANLQARSMRGLYNGGIVPLGYKTIEGKKGHLAIDEEQASLVRTAFDAFIKNETLTPTATWLNKHGYSLPKRMRNGGDKPRIGHFTTSNLQYILRNKAYIGVKTHKIQGTQKSAPAVWPAIISESIFSKAQELLALNNSRKKVHVCERYAFSLAGLVFCNSCGDHLSGKSAHGNGGKIPYYEHAWLTKKQACLEKKTFNCSPNRVLAKTLEKLVWEKLEAILSDKENAKSLISEARESHLKHQQSDPSKKTRDKIKSINAQIEALAERIAELPKDLPAEPFYKQMEKMLAMKDRETDLLKNLSTSPEHGDVPAEFPQFSLFLDVLNKFKDNPLVADAKAKIVQRMVSKILVSKDGFKLYFHVRQGHIERTLGEIAEVNRMTDNKVAWGAKNKGPSAGLAEGLRSSYFGSNIFRNGWGTRIRT